jgi:tRNA dimethylallyltransferase
METTVMDTEAIKCLALAGPTASGKTAAALAIAQAFAPTHPVEIISVDSALVYRGMDIGTAKPCATELATVPHHLINIRDPLNAYSAADFVRDATTLIGAIHARGRLPVLVGGTMLYFKALFEGLDDMPQANASVRAVIEAQAQARGWAAMHAELATVDPITAARLNPADAQRIQRALEVYRIAGQPMSALHTTKKNAVQTPATNTPDQNGIDFSGHQALLISLEPQDRAWLHARIAQRFDTMLAGGFLDEVRALRARGDLNPDLPAMRCVGYRQAWDYLDAPDGTKGLAELRDKGIFATRQLAKRQITWLRAMPQRRVVACDTPGALQQVLALARAWVSA